ncbi:hypothetical protein [Roseovarius sp. SYSU LYC5161]|uniref:hypothetical protein n=1 Tax=Roseovarius halophilus (ex Wu et al. 2025) TaxID=3376060 RepID=UPI00399BEB42
MTRWDYCVKFVLPQRPPHLHRRPEISAFRRQDNQTDRSMRLRTHGVRDYVGVARGDFALDNNSEDAIVGIVISNFPPDFGQADGGEKDKTNGQL